MTAPTTPHDLGRRELLSRAVALGTAFAVGAGYVMSPGGAWALEVKALKPGSMATLIQLARDIYPHDRVADAFYATAVKSHDDKAAGDAAYLGFVEDGIADLDTRARAAGASSYLGLAWEEERVAILRAVASSAFFQAVRGGLIGGLYNQKEVWPLFGYEGESFSKGGYIDRGFDDINWL
jgi:hypothetical protein